MWGRERGRSRAVGMADEMAGHWGVGWAGRSGAWLAVHGVWGVCVCVCVCGGMVMS